MKPAQVAESQQQDEENNSNQDIYDVEESPVASADSENEVEETTDLSEAQNTQNVLEVEPEPEKEKTTKKKLLSTLNSQRKVVKNHGIYKWLENYWDSGKTLRIMKPFLKALDETAVNQKSKCLFKVRQVIQKIMKEFIGHLKSQKKNLRHCSHDIFEEWSSKEGLSMMYENLQTTAWEQDLENTLFDHYTTCLLTYEKKQKSLEEEQSEEENTIYPGSLSSQSMKNTCTSSMTALPPAVASTSRGYVSTLPISPTPKKSSSGLSVKRVTFRKENLTSTKRKLNLDSEDEAYLLESHEATDEEESEPDVEVPILVKENKKRKLQIKEKEQKKRKMETDMEMDIEEEDEDQNEEDYSSMVASLARAHSLVSNTGRISQNICIREDDGLLTISSPGERGSSLVKLELYPFKECSRLNKNQYWTKRTFTSLAVVSGEESPVYKLAMKLRTAITKQIMSLKDIKVEKKAIIGWKGI